MPSPSSLTTTSTTGRCAPDSRTSWRRRSRAAPRVTGPRRAGTRSRSGWTGSGRAGRGRPTPRAGSSAHLDENRSLLAGRWPRPARRGRSSTAATSTGSGRICSRPESMRETSSSSVISRVTRSASASIVSSISRFCSSVNRSQRRSRVEVKPFTEVSGERSSWATVEMTAAWSASARRRYAVSRSRSTTRFDRPGRGPAAGSVAVTSTSRPSWRSMSSFSRWPVRVAARSTGRCTAHHDAPSRVLQVDRLADVAADELRAADVRGSRAARRLTEQDRRRRRRRRPGRPGAAPQRRAARTVGADRACPGVKSMAPTSDGRVAPGRRVEAHRGGHREVERLGPAVDRDPHHLVAQRARTSRAGPTPRCPSPRRAAGREVDLGQQRRRRRRRRRAPGCRASRSRRQASARPAAR